MLSIVIATYNSERTIRNAFNSILNLDYEDWECIIVDGLSKDNTLSLIKEYAAKDSRFRFISEKDDGIYDALNKGIKLAHGDWVYVLGSDDRVTEFGLRDLIKEAKVDDDVIYGNVYLESPTGKITRFIAKSVRHIKYVMICSHQAVIVKRSTINKLGGFNNKYSIRADFDLLQRAFINRYKFRKVDTFVAYYLTSGFSSNAKMSTHKERYEICKNNRSTTFPLLLFIYQECKYIFRFIINIFMNK